MSDIAIKVENLSKRYRIGLEEKRPETMMESAFSWLKSPLSNYRRLRQLSAFGENGDAEDVIWALKDVSFEVNQGEVVGIIGRNGAGKSTLLKVLSKITAPTAGRVVLNGRVASLLEVGTGFHPDLTGRENIYLNGTILGMTKADVNRRFDEIVAFSEVKKFIDTPVKRYSSGMQVRLAFAVAAHLDPEILLVDEVLAVGDLAFQKKCLGKMDEVSKSGRTVLLVSHNMGSILDLCQTSIYMQYGERVIKGETGQIVRHYQDSFLQQANNQLDKPQGKVWFGSIRTGKEDDFVLYADESFQLQTSFGVQNKISGFRMFCIVENARGEILIHSRVLSSEVENYSTDFNNYDVVVDIPPLWLNPGMYTAYFKLLAYGTSGESSKCLSERVPLTIVGKANPTTTILNPPVSWSLKMKNEIVPPSKSFLTKN